MIRRGMRVYRTGASLVVAILFAAGCATTQQTRDIDYSGFLDDYSQLERGGDDQAQRLFIDPHADFSRYDRVQLEQVTIWSSKRLEDVPEEELQSLADYLYKAVRERLRQDYALVDTPGPGVMRVRVAITEAEGSNVTMDTLSTTIPQLRLISSGKELVTGTHAFVGRAAIEAEVVDSATHHRLAAAVDERAGGKSFSGVTSKWGDVEQAFDFWAERFGTRLGELRSGNGR